MYLEHFGLKEPPFSITPDPRFVYLSERHRDALAHLLFGIGQGGGGGFVQLTGEVGTGKTTLCRLLLEQVPDTTRVALVLNPRLTPVELLETICEELHVAIDGDGEGNGRSVRGSLKALVDALNRYLLDAYAQGLRVVLIIDEAQDLSIEALEQVRLLTNLETDTQKLLQVILLGQPELRTLLAREDLRQLSQRITARFHLTPLDAAETGRYLRHRHAIAGGLHLPFSPAAIRRLHAHAGGVPRLINIIAERSLLAGYARDATRVDARLVDVAASEALAPRAWRRRLSTGRLAAAAAIVLMVMAGWIALRPNAPEPVAVARAAPKASVSQPATLVDPARIRPPRLQQAELLRHVADVPVSSPDAWAALLQAWRLPTDTDDVAIASRCAPQLAPGVYCLHTHASLDTLAAIGRPVLLRLRGGNHAAWALLLGLDALDARLRVGGAIVDVPRVVLQRNWDGELVAIWRTSAPAQAVPRPADVRAFQSAHGLAVDGVVGLETRFALAAGGPGPQLLRELD